MGVGAVFGNGLAIPGLTPDSHIPFLAAFLLNLFIIGAFYAVFYAFGLATVHRKELFALFKKQHPGKFKIAALLFSGFLAASFFIFKAGFQTIVTAFTLGSFLLFNLIFFVKSVEKIALERWVPVQHLTEGDWVINTVKVGTKTICSPKDLGLEKEQISLLKKHNIKKVLVKDGIPFVPSFFLALLATLIWGNILFSFL